MSRWDDLFTIPETTPTPLTSVNTGQASSYAAAALRREAEAVATAANGTRNHTLNKAWFNMGRHVGAGNIDPTTVRDALTAAGRACGLDDHEIAVVLRDDSTSALNAGTALPRHPAPLPDLPGVTVLTTPVLEADPSTLDSDGDAGAEPEVASWAPLDLDDVLDGTYEPELPALMPRLDEACLLYPGRIHSFHGESESGKSLVAQAEAARLISDAHDVLFVDFESDRAAVVGRLLELGASHQQIRAHFTYVRPEVDPRRFPHERLAVAELLGKPYALAVVDGVTEALGIFGASTKDNDEITAFMRVLPRTIARLTGAAVVLVDHVTKDSEGRGRFAIGGQAKMAALDGAAYVVEVTEALGRGKRGMVVLRVAKDRPGGVRAQAGPFRATDRTQEAARIVIDSTDLGTGGPHVGIRVEVRAPLTEEQGAGGFRPTHVMEKISRFVEQADEPVSGRIITEAVGGRAEVVRSALALLVRDHFVRAENGARNALLHSSIQPYREDSDPASPSYVTTLNPERVRPRPDRVPDALPVTASRTPVRGPDGTRSHPAGTSSSASHSEGADFEDSLSPRTGRAWAAADKLLADGEWHSWTDVVTAMVVASDVQDVTCSNRIHEAVKVGLLERRGSHPRRDVRLAPRAEDQPQASTQLVACSKCFRPTPETDTDNGRCGQCVARDGELR